MSLTLAAPKRFRLDRERFSKHLIGDAGDRFGFDSADQRGFAAAIASRFYDAVEAAAILGPSDLEVVVYAAATDSLIVAVRERGLPRHLDSPLRQLATFSFETGEIACYGDESFAECCTGIEALLDRANALLPSLAAMREAERDGQRR